MRVPIRQFLSSVALVALVAAAAACGGSDSDGVTAAPAAGDVASGDGAGDSSVVSWVLPTVAGGQLDFADLAGQDAILWFWAPW